MIRKIAAVIIAAVINSCAPVYAGPIFVKDAGITQP